ncbi:MAG TPA: 2-oxoacid:acceptor oxidoreductase family protein [Limnochordales bacterium]
MSGTRSIRLMGRGGQGTVTASKLLVAAAVAEGLYAQAVPSYGQERKGAPVFAYARIDHRPIWMHSFVYEADAVVVFDLSLVSLGIDVLTGLVPGGIVVVNSPSPPEPEALKVAPDRPLPEELQLFWVDATGITRAEIGPVPPNAAMLGALAGATGWVSIDTVADAIQQGMGARVGPANVRAARRAFEAVRPVGPVPARGGAGAGLP